jgi:hypothetical protein
LPTNSSNPTFSSIKPEERSTRKERGQQRPQTSKRKMGQSPTHINITPSSSLETTTFVNTTANNFVSLATTHENQSLHQARDHGAREETTITRARWNPKPQS